MWRWGGRFKGVDRATNLRRGTIKAYPFALSLSKGERLSRSWFDKLTTNGLACPALSW